MSTMSVKPEPMDPLNIDQFFDGEAATLTSPYSTTSTLPPSAKGKTIATPEFRTPDPQTLTIPPPPPAPTAFAGPSHPYGQHRQHIGLPVGGLANSLANAPQPTLGYGGMGGAYRMGSSSGIPDMTLNDDFFDFGSPATTHKASMSTASDVDMEFDAAGDLFNDIDAGSGFVDPNMVGGHEDDSPTPVQSKVGQLWPGMHKKEAMEKQKQQISAVQPVTGPSIQKRPTTSKPVDPLVEKSISRILDQMRHNNTSDDQDASPPPSHLHVSRSKKDEEDMDEDERLLASEEGKKLSSKERRQLRNKVSARAFRSRRKEYISQLEGELATKGQENDELRLRNQELADENTRLTDLTRLLLSAPAFNQFLADLNTNGIPSLPSNDAIPQQQQQPPQPSSQPREQRLARDVNPAQAPKVERRGDAQVSMATIPETPMDFAPDTMNWGSGIDFGINVQVFSVDSLPEGPSIDTAVLSEKPVENAEPLITFPQEEKVYAPVVAEAPRVEKAEEPAAEQVCEDMDFDESDPAFALFVDVPAKLSAPTVDGDEGHQLFGGIAPEKAFARYDLVIAGSLEDKDAAAALDRFERVRAGLDAMAERIARLTGDL